MALSTKYAWSEWGGVPMPSEKLPVAFNPEDGIKLEQRARAAVERPGAALRVQERAEARQRLKVQQVLDTLRSQIEMQGSVAAAFRKLEVSGDAKISADELKKALKNRFSIEMSEETTRRVIREFDANGDGEIEYKEFVSCLLGKLDIDTTGDREGAKGGGGKHVKMASDAAEQKAAAAQRAADVGDLNVHRRLAAATAMDTMKQRLQTKYAHVREAFRKIDVDSDNALSYDEFGGLVSEWLPELPQEQVRDVCRLLDADGDGTIDFEDFASVMAAQGDDMRRSSAGVLRQRESRQLRQMAGGRTRGRFGATPAVAYGVQVRELLSSFPGAASYLPERERFAAVGRQLVPDWQVADAARRVQRRDVRREQMRFHTQRIEAVSAARQRKAEEMHDKRMESMLAQKQRYLSSVASENRASLRVQATFRHTQPPGAATGLEQLTSPRS
jgi:Ca2+-binding EF-hand superfamily protein